MTLYEVALARHWGALLGMERAGLGDDFFESGGSSIKLIELLHHLQAEFGIAIPVSRLYRVTTLHGMAAAVEDVVTGTAAEELPCLSFNPQRGAPLFCFPPAGGHGLVYRLFAAELPEYRVVAFNYLPGEDKVTRYADLVESVVPEGPCHLLGYSLGGNLAFEVAKELEAPWAARSVMSWCSTRAASSSRTSQARRASRRSRRSSVAPVQAHRFARSSPPPCSNTRRSTWVSAAEPPTPGR